MEELQTNKVWQDCRQGRGQEGERGRLLKERRGRLEGRLGTKSLLEEPGSSKCDGFSVAELFPGAHESTCSSCWKGRVVSLGKVKDASSSWVCSG